ncbi:MAG: LysM peptidoglycan-binding domain-containing protein [Planctomycetes bacterium]|nr:LysM peptidoglycan-binding domain-containing protein [Planctomycetota bacterium]
MSDVEKYGLWAVIGFTGILVLIGLGGDGDEPLQREAARPQVVHGSSQPVVVAPPASAEKPATRKAVGKRAESQAAPGSRVLTVPPVVPSGESFRWEESPVAYPGPRSARTPGHADDAVITHTVAKGETLGDISARYYGTATRWRELLALNPGVDEKRIKPGDVIVVQGAPRRGAEAPVAMKAEVPASKGAARTYVVRDGDTLGEIAAKMLGSARRSQELYEANRHVLSSPDRLRTGQVLTIP